jgi:mono/diheme cytochrome c family protein
MTIRVVFSLFMLSMLSMIGCAGPGSDQTVLKPIELASAEEKEGQVLFMKFCHSCHPDGEAGLGPSIHAMPAPNFLQRTQVRAGMGEMPAFHDDKISDEQLDAIIAYLNTADDQG